MTGTHKDPFTFHTECETREAGTDQHLLDKCPFCFTKEGKTNNGVFYYTDEGLWHCHVCSREGNKYTFMQQLLEDICVSSKNAYIAITKQLPEKLITDLGIRYNPLTDTYVIPTYNSNGNLNGLYKYNYNSNMVMNCAGMPKTLFNWDRELFDTIWLCEGHWDKIAGDAIVGPSGAISCVGVPGATSFKEDWDLLWKDKHIVILFDNDEAGEKGTKRILEKIMPKSTHKPMSIKVLKWTQDMPPGSDLRDVYVRHGAAAMNWIEQHIEEYRPPEGVVVTKPAVEVVEEDLSVETFDQLIERFKGPYHMTEDMEIALLLVLTSIFSIRVAGEQIWIRMIGVPGSGKTTIAKAVGASPQVVLRSMFTGLFSGFRDENNPDADAGLIPEIANKTLIVKDADSLLKRGNVSEIMSQLRDFYDKSSHVQYMNAKKFEYDNVSSTMILCGTNVLRRTDQAFLGERFLDIEMRVSKADEAIIKKKMYERSVQVGLNHSAPDPELDVKRATKGFIINMMKKIPEQAPSDEVGEMVMDLGSLISKMRAKVDRDNRTREILSNPAVELPTRIIGQMTKICLCAPVVAGDAWVERLPRLLKKITKDIIDTRSLRFRICLMLLEHSSMNFNSIVEAFEPQGYAKTTLDREMHDLKLIGAVEITIQRVNDKGHKQYWFSLNAEVRQQLSRLL